MVQKVTNSRKVLKYILSKMLFLLQNIRHVTILTISLNGEKDIFKQPLLWAEKVQHIVQNTALEQHQGE